MAVKGNLPLSKCRHVADSRSYYIVYTVWLAVETIIIYFLCRSMSL